MPRPGLRLAGGMTMTYTHVKTTVLGTILLALVVASPAAAQDVGGRAGVSGDPDQFYFGVHAEAGPVADVVMFRPNMEVGVGNGVTLVAFNLEFVYRVPLKDSPWRLLAGGGPALNIARAHGNTDSGGGLNVLLGLEHRDGLFFEFKVGAVDSPNVKFAVGYTIRP